MTLVYQELGRPPYQQRQLHWPNVHLYHASFSGQPSHGPGFFQLKAHWSNKKQTFEMYAWLYGSFNLVAKLNILAIS